jgi:hypothetical protein
VIPKIIHYCWFGRGPKPQDVLQNIEGWKRLHPDFQVIEWNESNFDINVCDYVREAYACRKFAFVSDYARGLALHKQGGVYLDCDVELVGSLEPFLQHSAFWGFEANEYVATSTIGCVPNYSLIQEYLDQYHRRKFLKSDGSADLTTNVVVINQILERRGLVRNGQKQILRDQSVVYPLQVFSPLDYIMHINHRDQSTVAIHHYQHTWGGVSVRWKKAVSQVLAKVLGARLYGKLKNLIRR